MKFKIQHYNHNLISNDDKKKWLKTLPAFSGTHLHEYHEQQEQWTLNNQFVKGLW